LPNRYNRSPYRNDSRILFTIHHILYALIAAEETQAYLKERTEWREELQTGKMFGVLVVRTPAGEVGYLAAFSGNLAGKNVHPFFVPPIYDLLQPDGFFRQEEEQINEINARIRTQQASPALEDARSRLQSTIEYCDFVLQAAKDFHVLALFNKKCGLFFRERELPKSVALLFPLFHQVFCGL